MVKDLTIQLCRNVWLEGDTIISYETKVARIRDGKIWMNGKYSRTTNKQMHKVASMLGLGLETCPTTRNFYKYENGVRISHEKSLSLSLSKQLLPHLKHGLQEALASAKSIPKGDWPKVISWLEWNGHSVADFKRKREYYQLSEVVDLVPNFFPPSPCRILAS